MLLIIAATILGTLGEGATGPWEPAEHRVLADSALSAVVSVLGGDAPTIPGANASLTVITPVWGDLTFGRLAQKLAREDGDASRFQKAGRTVFEQLSEVSASDLRSFWERVKGSGGTSGGGDLIHPGAETAVGNYLLAHTAALHFAAEAGSADPPEERAFYRMLAYEAMAQGFLADAHSAGHLLVPRHDALQGFHPVNNGRAHRHYNFEGVYVVNGRQEVWQAFGDGTLTWYSRSYRQVLEASTTSVKEVFLSFFEAKGSVPDPLMQWIDSFTDRSTSDLVAEWLTWKEGQVYYERYASMPSLSHIPMPVSATWSVRGDARDRHGVRIRMHYPQLREYGLHDPKLPRLLIRNLYSKDALPGRFVPQTPGLSPVTPDTTGAFKTHKDVASVEFFQVHRLDPDYTGLLLGFGAGMMTGDDRSAPALTASVGYGIFDDILIAKHISANIGISKSFEDDFVSPVKATFGLNPLGCPLRTEFGYVTTTDDFTSESGFVLSGALDITSRVLGLTYIGVVVRLAYEVMFLDEVLHAPSIRITFY